MTWTRNILRRDAHVFTLFVAAALTVMLCAHEARSQQPSTAEQMQTLMKHRQELSNRSVEEPTKRRFEDKKSDTVFPSDNAKRKAGVLHAFTPEQQKALQHNERGMELFSKGKLDGAIKEYEAAIRLDPKLAAAHNNLGSAQFAAARFEESAAAFRQSSELDPESGQALFNLALAQIKLGRQKEANEALDSALRRYNSAGETHLKAGHLKEAEEAFRGMLQIDPEYGPALLRLALVHIDARRYEEAVQCVRRVAEREPANAIAHELLAEALYGQQKYEEAAVSAESALKLSPDFSVALYTAGLARASLGQRDTALAHLARLRQLNSPTLAQQLSEFIDKKAPAK
ncbi:MAG TPA: tetratricopeptide repeat protein [Pyrinomonadaceae bacterium]|nr:tetratricopeptide repeat protein [Pyrinomonadaceae bacterium]